MSAKLDFFEHKTPSVIGWYAVLICYDLHEGGFPSAGYWNGEEWNRKAVVGYIEPVQPDADAATNWGYENDPDM